MDRLSPRFPRAKGADQHRDCLRGFTLIEVIAVLIIIGVIAAVSLSRVASTKYHEVVSEAALLKTNLRYAQLRALSDASTALGGNANTWGLSLSAGSYTLQRNGAQAPSNLPGENSPTRTFPGGVSLTSGAGTTVTYDVWGSPGTSTIALTLSDGTSPHAITITRNTGFIP